LNSDVFVALLLILTIIVFVLGYVMTYLMIPKPRRIPPKYRIFAIVWVSLYSTGFGILILTTFYFFMEVKS
jgi:cytochrome c oxidase assembly factor CtaG